MARPTRSTLFEIGAAILLFTVVSVATLYQQKITLIRYWDSDEYYWMTYNMATRQPIRASAPWVYRIGVPWVASLPFRYLLTRGYPYWTIKYPYYIMNVSAALATTLLLIVWLRRFVDSVVIRLLVVLMFLVEWHGPVRFVYFYPVYVDPVFIVFLLGGLMLIEHSRGHSPGRVSPLLAVVCALGTLCRESMIVVALAFIVAHNPFSAPTRTAWRRDLVAAAAPLVASLLAIVFAHAIVTPKAPYSATAEALRVSTEKPLFTWALAWFLTFGPGVAAVIAYDGRAALQFLRQRPYLAFYLIACGLLGFAGGTDTERVLFWALPVVYVLAARAVERDWPVLKSGPLPIVLLAAQMISARVLWPIPDVLTSPMAFGDVTRLGPRVYSALNRVVVIDDYYWNLWSYFGSRRWHALLLAYDVAFAIAIVVWMRWRATGSIRSACPDR